MQKVAIHNHHTWQNWAHCVLSLGSCFVTHAVGGPIGAPAGVVVPGLCWLRQVPFVR